MKKILLSGLALFVAFGAMAQTNRLKNARLYDHVSPKTALSQEVNVPLTPGTPLKKHTSNAARVTTVSSQIIGGMPNANGMAFTARKPLFAHPAINTVSMVHRNQAATFGGTTGQLRYAVSTDGGVTWGTTNAMLYDAPGATAAPFANARYPQGAIYNPIGNTTPANASICFFAPDLGNTAAPCSTPFGGHINGSISVAGGTATKTEDLTATDNYIMDDMALNTVDNNLWVAQGYYDMSGTQTFGCDYNDSVILRKGVWTAGDYVYSKQLINAPVALRADGSKMWEQTRMAWAPNGMIGYVVNMGHESFIDSPDSVRYPVVFKTTNAGATWARVAALNVGSIDSMIGFIRAGYTDITEGFDFNLCVGSDNNLHIFLPVVPAGATYTQFYDRPVLCDVFTTNGGSLWTANMLAIPAGGSVGAFLSSTGAAAFQEYNRPQITRTLDGSKMFFTWFETDTLIWGSSVGNVQPDMWTVGLDVATGLYTDSMNLTAGTAADGACNFAVISPLVLPGSGAGCYNIPAAYLSSPSNGTYDGSLNVNYIGGAEICAPFTKTAAFTTPVGNYVVTGIHENSASSFSVSQNYPNPFRGETRLDITVQNSSNGGIIEISNILGKVVKTIKLNTLTTGSNTVVIDGTELSAGIYTYTVTIGGEKVSSKLMVK